MAPRRTTVLAQPLGWPAQGRLALLLGLALGLATWAAPALAQSSSGGAGIYTCTDAKGRRLTADRPIADCRHKEQQILNSDGSLRGVLPPTLTAEERAEQDERDRLEKEARAARAEVVRRDRNLLARYPTELSHQRAREAALDTVRLAIRATELRLRDLREERKPLLDETEFYAGRPLPQRLRAALDANDAAVAAQRSAAINQQAELERINGLFDTELDRLRRLWAGALPGSLGPLPASQPAAPPQPRTGTAQPSAAGASRAG